MSKAEIIAELAHLSPQDLADVRAWLDRLSLDKTASTSGKAGTVSARIRSPRLAKPAQATDFTKQVTELSPHAGL
jgi:hypothetical protein